MAILTEVSHNFPQFFQQNGILPTLHQITSFKIILNSPSHHYHYKVSVSLGFEAQWEQEIFSLTPVQTSPGANPASYTMDTGTIS
jgi:hypothetical protein